MALRRSIALLTLGSVRETTILRRGAWICLHSQQRQASRRTPFLNDHRNRNHSERDYDKRDANLDQAVLLLAEADLETMPGAVELMKSEPLYHAAALRMIQTFVRAFANLCCASGAYELQTPTLDKYQQLLSLLNPRPPLPSLGPPQIGWVAEQLLDSYNKNKHLRILAQHLLKLQMMKGDLNATMILLLSIGYEGDGDHTKKKLVDSGRILLQKALRQKPIASVWRAAVLEGMILESRGLLDEALTMYKRAMEGQQQSLSISEAATQAESLQQPRSALDPSSKPHSQYIELLETPWNNAIECYSKKSEIEGVRLDAMKLESRKMIDMAVRGNDARRMRDAAILSHREYRAEQWAEEFDGSLKMTRVPRHPEHMHGTSARWLYYMTKSAKMLVPKACCDLGRYYAYVPWPFLDEEPPDSVKPTSFDRYPGRISRSHILTCLARAIGLPGTRKTVYEDTFRSASLPATAEKRMLLAVDWLEIAAELGYAPALRDLLEIYTSKTVSAQKSVPSGNVTLSRSRYVYRDKAKYWSDLDLNDHDIDRTPDTRRKVTNPTFSVEKAKDTVLRICRALEAVRMHQSPSQRRWVYQPELCLPLLQKEAFTEWCYDEDERKQLSLMVQSVCEENAWNEYKDYRRTIAES